MVIEERNVCSIAHLIDGWIGTGQHAYHLNLTLVRNPHQDQLYWANTTHSPDAELVT